MANAIKTSGLLNDFSGAIGNGGTAQSLLVANRNRRYFLFQNNSTADLWINFGAVAVQAPPSIKIPAGATMIMEDTFCSNQSVSVVGAVTGQVYTCKEGV